MMIWDMTYDFFFGETAKFHTNSVHQLSKSIQLAVELLAGIQLLPYYPKWLLEYCDCHVIAVSVPYHKNNTLEKNFKMISSTSLLLLFLSICVLCSCRPPFPKPTYEYLTCGSRWEGNTTFISYSLYDYFAVVNASSFKLIASSWSVQASSPACENGVYLMFLPINENGSYGKL